MNFFHLWMLIFFSSLKWTLITWQKLIKQGGVGLRIRVYDRIMCFVNCHLAAHLEAVNRRNADFDHIYRNMVFTRSSNLLNTAAGMVPYLFLLCSLAFSTYLFWLLYSSGLPLVLSVTAGVSTSVHVLRGTNVSLMFTAQISIICISIPFHRYLHLKCITVQGLHCVS